MKKLFSTFYNTNAANVWLLLLRAGVAGLMLTHGFPKLQMLLNGGEIQFPDPLGVGSTLSLLLAVFAEAFCAVLLFLGLATRFASAVLAFTMGVAAFIIHAADPLGKKEMAILYLLIFLTLLVFGPGRYSLDNLISGGKSGKPKKKAARG